VLFAFESEDEDEDESEDFESALLESEDFESDLPSEELDPELGFASGSLAAPLPLFL
jgi:hypothetical protein